MPEPTDERLLEALRELPLYRGPIAGGEDDDGDDSGDPGAAADDEGQDDGEEDPGFTPAQQRFLQKLLNQYTARERSRFERNLKKTLGTANLNEAAQYVQIGQTMVQKSGVQPHDVLNRLKAYRPAGGTVYGGNTQGNDNPDLASVRQELSDVKNLILSKDEQAARQQQETEARKEFGSLYDEHVDAIEDLADERGLSLVDAAAIVLRPHLYRIAEQRAQDKRAKQRRKAVDSSEEGTRGVGDDFRSKLSPAQQEVARKMRLSYKRYYEQLKALGEI